MAEISREEIEAAIVVAVGEAVAEICQRLKDIRALRPNDGDLIVTRLVRALKVAAEVVAMVNIPEQQEEHSDITVADVELVLRYYVRKWPDVTAKILGNSALGNCEASSAGGGGEE